MIILCTFALANQNLTGSSAVGSALRSGRRGRAFESPLPDKTITLGSNSGRFFLYLCTYWKIVAQRKINGDKQKS